MLKKMRLEYDGSGNISIEDGRLIAEKLTLPLTKVFTNSECNARVLQIFLSSGIFGNLECEPLRTIQISQTWVETFCRLLKNRFNIRKALNVLLNLDNDTDLVNYQKHIISIFEKLSLPKQLRVVDTSDTEPRPGCSTNTSRLTQKTIPEERFETSQSQNSNHSSIPIPVDVPNPVNNKDVPPSESPTPCNNTIIHIPDSQDTTESSEEPQSQAPLILPTDPSGSTERLSTHQKMVHLLAVGLVLVFATVGTVAAVTNVTARGSTNKNDSFIASSGNVVLNEILTADVPEVPLEASNAPEIVVENPTGREIQEDAFQIISADSSTNHQSAELLLLGTTTSASVIADKKRSGQKKDNQQQIHINNPVDLKNRTLEICDPDVVTTVVICINNHYDWDGIQIDCAARIYSLKIDCSPSVKNLDEILQQTTNVGKLQIQCDKIVLRNPGIPFISVQPSLDKLRDLDVSSRSTASDCGDFFSYFARNVGHSNLTKVAIKGIAVVDRNTAEIQRTISKVKYSEIIEIILSNVAMHAFLDITSKGGSVNFSKVHFQPIYNTHAARKTVDNLLTNANYIKDFLTTVPFQDDVKVMQRALKDFKRLQMQSLEMVLHVKEGRSSISFNFINKLKHLKHFELRLIDWKKGSHTKIYLVLRDLATLPESLSEFKVTTNFETQSIGPIGLCRIFEKSRNDQGGMTLDLNTCHDCDILNGCIT